jgi:transcriptional antiterminator
VVKTIKQLADELKVSKQTIQYHYQRLPAKNQQKDSKGKNLISPLAESIIKDRMSKSLLAKNHQNDSKEPTKTSKEDNDLITTLRREVRDLKSERDKQLATKDRQIDRLTKLLDQQQQLQLTTVTENCKLKKHVQRLSSLIESSNPKPLKNKYVKMHNEQQLGKKKAIKNWWRFW